jgi:uncharacterized membrane protein
MIEVKIYPPQDGNYVDENSNTIFALNRLRQNVLFINNGTNSTIAEVEIVKFAAELTTCIDVAVTQGACMSEGSSFSLGTALRLR